MYRIKREATNDSSHAKRTICPSDNTEERRKEVEISTQIQ